MPIPKHFLTPAFVPAHFGNEDFHETPMHGLDNVSSEGDHVTITTETQQPTPTPFGNTSSPSNAVEKPANIDTDLQTRTSHEFVIDLGYGREKGKNNSLGRQGPLNESTLANSKAVKAIGACWKCKVLRKKVKTRPPNFDHLTSVDES